MAVRDTMALNAVNIHSLHLQISGLHYNLNLLVWYRPFGRLMGQRGYKYFSKKT